MKFTVEINDYWIEDGELSEELTRAIKQETVSAIMAKTREQTQKSIGEAINKIIHESIQGQINETISEFVDTGMLLISGKEVSITDHMKTVFQSNHGWNNPSEKMAQIAKVFGEDLKKQYNAIFATKVVMNMHAQGFLKDDMAQILLTNNKTG